MASPDDYYGFLTVDCNSINVFNPSYDVEMGAAIADALFPIFDMFSKITAGKESTMERSYGTA